MNNCKVTSTIATLKRKFLDGWILSVGFSGKDSFVTLHCAIEALKLAMKENPNVGAKLYVNTVDTTIDNFEISAFLRKAHQHVERYAKDHQLPIETVTLYPPINQRPLVQYIGRGVLLRTYENQANARQCTSDWKIDSVKRFMKSLEQKHQTTKILSLSGSRDSESAARAANLAKRGESIDTITETDLGYKLAPIKDWDFKDVWFLIGQIDNGDVESFGEDLTRELTKHYSAGNGGSCDLLAGEGAVRSKPCSSRFGCTLCCLVKHDFSLQNQIDLAPHQYGYMQGVLDLREFMFNTVNDYERCRSMVGKRVDNGFIKIGHNDYSMEFRQELLRYTLTLDALEQERAFKAGEPPKFQLIKHADLVAIQFYWAKVGGETSAGQAFQIWHEVHTEHKRFAIPKTTYVPASSMAKFGKRRVNIQKLIDTLATSGLAITQDDRQSMTVHRFFMKGDSVETTAFEESERFTVCDEEALSEYIEGVVYDYMLDGKLDETVCPSVIVKDMLARGVIKIKKGGMPALHNDIRRAQVVTYLIAQQKHHEAYLVANSVEEGSYFATLENTQKAPVAIGSPQIDMFAV